MKNKRGKVKVAKTKKTKTAKTKKTKKSGKIERINTGIPNLDRITGGGFKKRSTNLVIGQPGTGKTIMSIQFLIEGIKKGEKVVYLTFEEKREKIFGDMKAFGWDLEKYEKEGKFTFLEYTAEQIKKSLNEGGGELENLIERTKAKRIVIDAMNSFIMSYEDELMRKEAYLFLFELLDKWDCTTLLTFGTTKEEQSDSLGFSVDTIITLSHEKKTGKRERFLEIVKMTGTKTPSKNFRFEITSRGFHLFG